MRKNLLLAVLVGLMSPAFAAQNAELAFYQRQAAVQADTAKQDRAFASELARQVGLWAAQHPQEPEVKTALLMQSDYYTRAKEYGRALVALYQVRFYFPEGQDLKQLSAQVEQAAEAIDADQKAQALKLLAVNTSGLNDMQKRAALLEGLVQSRLDGVYEPVNDLFDTFFTAYPAYPQNDKLTLLYGDWQRQNGNFYAAIAAYKKVNELYPDTPYKAAALRMAADVYAGDLKAYETAESLYNQVLEQYPDSNERGVVYKHLAVMNENRKDYPVALVYYNKAIVDLADRPAAYDAWRGKADVLVKTKDYQGAYKTLSEAAQVFSSDEEKYVSSLTAAADIARKRLKSPALQAAALDKILLAYPQTHTAPQVMYDLGYAYEKQNKNAPAAEVYKRLIINYPTDKYAARAQSRLNRLEK